MKLRIPGWAKGQPVPSDLYVQTRPSSVMDVSVAVNGRAVNGVPGMDGYLTIERMWKTGDTVELNLPMPVKRIRAHEKVEADRGRLAVERGPIVYCAEGCDNGGKAYDAVLPADATFTEEALRIGDQGFVALRASNGLRLVPYGIWGNREPGNEMQVWFREAMTPPRTKVAFTFDDGFKDGITVAAPILEKYGYRGMFCIIPGCVDAGNGMNWDDVRELMRRGHEISLHDGDPVGLCRRGRRAEAKEQLIRGRDRIREMTGVAPRFWTPPGQQISPDALALVKECGMIAARADRPDHGKATVAGTPNGVGAWLDRQLRYHPIAIALMCHAVADPGYNSFGSAKQFEDYVKEVKEREEKGLFDVVTYPELEPSEIQAISSTPKWTLSYRDGEGRSRTIESAEFSSYSVKTNGPNMWCEWRGAAPFRVVMNYVATLDGARIWGWVENASTNCTVTALKGPFVAEQSDGTYGEVRDFETGAPYVFDHAFELTPKKRFWELPTPVFMKGN